MQRRRHATMSCGQLPPSHGRSGPKPADADAHLLFATRAVRPTTTMAAAAAATSSSSLRAAATAVLQPPTSPARGRPSAYRRSAPPQPHLANRPAAAAVDHEDEGAREAAGL